MNNKPYNPFPEWVTAEDLERLMSHYRDGNFAFDLPTDVLTETVRGVTYHVIPHYADDGAEDIPNKLRRIMATELPKD